MGLFSRKKSSANVSSPRAERVPAMPAIAIPNNNYDGTSTGMRLQLSPEVSTPLYERFARTNELGVDDNNRLSIGLFDGSSIKGPAFEQFEARAAASSGFHTRDPVDAIPPSAFRDHNTSTPSPSRRRSVNLSAAPDPKAEHAASHGSSGIRLLNTDSNDHSIAFMQVHTSREQEDVVTNASLGRASQSLDLPRMPSARPPSRSTPSPKLREQQEQEQSVRQQRSRTLDSSSAGSRTTTVAVATPAPESAPPSRPPSSLVHRQSAVAFQTNPPQSTTTTPPPPTPTKNPIKNNPSSNISSRPTVVQPMHNDTNNAAYLLHSSQSIPQQQQEPQARIPHRSKTANTPTSALSADTSSRKPHSKIPSRSTVPASPPADAQYQKTPREHGSRRASTSYQPTITSPSPSHAYAQAQAHVHVQRPTLPSSPPVSGTSAGASSSFGTGATGSPSAHVLRRRSRSVISGAVGSDGSSSARGGTLEKEKANGAGGAGWHTSLPQSGTAPLPSHSLWEPGVPGSSAPSTFAQATRIVDTRAKTNPEKAPGGFERFDMANDTAIPGSSSTTRVRSPHDPTVLPTRMYPDGDSRMVAVVPPVPLAKEGTIGPGVAGVGAGMRHLSMNNSSNGYTHHPPQTTYMYSTQPPHVPAPGPPTSLPSATAAQHQLGGEPEKGDSSTSSRATFVSALSSSTVRSPAPSSRTSVSNGGGTTVGSRATPQRMTTDVSLMSLDPHGHQKMIKEREREKRREHRKLHKKNAAASEPESTSVPSVSSATISTPKTFESDAPITSAAVQPQVGVVNILGAGEEGEERLSDVMRAGDDDPFARVITPSPAPGSHASLDDVARSSLDDNVNAQLQPPQASSSSRRTPSSQSLSPSNPDLTPLPLEPLQPLPSPEDPSAAPKKRKHRSEKGKEKDRERKHRSRSSKHAGEGEGDPIGDGERRRRKHKEPIIDDGLVPVRKRRSHRDKDKDKDKDSERRRRRRRRHDEEPTPVDVTADAPAPPDTNSSIPMEPSLTVSSSANSRGLSSTQIEIMQADGAGDEVADPSHERDREREREQRHRHRRSRREHHHRHLSQSELEERPREPRYYPLAEHMCNAELLAPLVTHLTFPDFYALWNSTKLVWKFMEETPGLREIVLEKYLGSVGYRRWMFDERREPVSLSLKELNAYLRGVNVPTHHYPMIAADSFYLDPTDPRAGDVQIREKQMAASTRAYTKLVVRLRAQAELEQMHWDLQQESTPRAEPPSPPLLMPIPRHANGNGPPVTLGPRYGRVNSSSASVSDSGHGGHSHPPVSRAASAAAKYRNRPHKRSASVAHSVAPSVLSTVENGSAAYGGGVAVRGVYRFRSPLFKLGHAPLLRVFVPNREGVWLSDDNVIKCEQELNRAGVIPFLKVGDVVWDVAVGDENNIGRMIWDGAYLIDLDYTYSLPGEIPPYIDSLCFPPSYWHKILRIPGDPIVHIDIEPYAREIAANLALLQSRVQTETPQGTYHTVVRWINRSSFQLRGETPLLPRRPNAASQNGGRTPMIDQAWEGTIFIEAEGTNEGLQELQERIGPDVQIVQSGKPFHQPPERKGMKPRGKTVYRMIRAQSRPGELWLRCAREKEKVLS